MTVKGSVVIITGASSGIGLAVARLLAKHGATVVLAARSAGKLNQIEKEIRGAVSVPTDMLKPEEVTRLIRTTCDKFGRIDALINSAGQGMRATVEEINIEDYKSIMELNVFSVLRAMQAVIPIMRKQGKGLILNIGSRVSKNYFPERAAYASTKYALNAISFTAREELFKDHISVCVFHPKLTMTNFGQNAFGKKYESISEYSILTGRPNLNADTPEAVAEGILKQIESEEAEVIF